MFAFGFQTNLTVALDVSGTETQAQNATTALSSLTFGVPDNLWDAATGALKPMDKSWYACRHTYISVEAMPREGLYAGEGCGFLPDDCIKDLQSSMAKNWGQAADDTTSYMCSGYTMDYIPKSCRGVVGLIREDVTGKNLLNPNHTLFLNTVLTTVNQDSMPMSPRISGSKRRSSPRARISTLGAWVRDISIHTTLERLLQLQTALILLELSTDTARELYHLQTSHFPRLYNVFPHDPQLPGAFVSSSFVVFVFFFFAQLIC